jgi:TPR repeat protein
MVLLLALLTANPALADSSADELYNQGMLSMERGDITAAIRQFKSAANNGSVAAMAKLGWVLDGAELNDEAVIWYQKAAEKGNAEGQYGLGTMYSKGEGVKQDNKQAFQWIAKSAEQQYSKGMELMAQVYELGLFDIEPDFDKANEIIDAGVATNMPWAIQRKAAALDNGELGLEINKAQAEKLKNKLKTITDAAKSTGSEGIQ